MGYVMSWGCSHLQGHSGEQVGGVLGRTGSEYVAKLCVHCLSEKCVPFLPLPALSVNQPAPSVNQLLACTSAAMLRQVCEAAEGRALRAAVGAGGQEGRH